MSLLHKDTPSAKRAGAFGGFGMPGGAEENDHGGELHPNEQTDYGGQPSIDHAVGHFANVKPKTEVGDPPKKSGNDRTGQHIAQTSLSRPRPTVNDGDGNHRQHQGNTMEEKGPQSFDGTA